MDRLAEVLGERTQTDPAALELRGFCQRQKKLDRGDVRLLDSGTVDLDLVLARGLSDHLICSANGRNAAVGRQSD
jgi:hypothetical protein